VFNSIRNQGVKAGEVVAIQGVGGLGHLAIQYANKMGYKVFNKKIKKITNQILVLTIVS
jgi:D-arabinose 1-dehydrogenase-like Zn-dependent alcohol dehydrogenase